MADQLIARQDAESKSDSTFAALRQASLELSSWVGPDGTSALFTRALARAGRQHPLLGQLTLVTNSAPALVGVPESIASNGADAVADALHETLVELFELLTRLVGADLAAKLAEQMLADTSKVSRDDGEAGV